MLEDAEAVDSRDTGVVRDEELEADSLSSFMDVSHGVQRGGKRSFSARPARDPAVSTTLQIEQGAVDGAGFVPPTSWFLTTCLRGLTAA